MEGGAKNEEHAARGTNDMRTQYAMQIVVCLAAGLVLAGCGNLAKTTRPEGLVAASQADPNLDLTITVPPRASDLDNEQYDPWESFNEKMFTFNYNVDKYALKPVARGYRAVVPEQVQIMLGNASTTSSGCRGSWTACSRESGKARCAKSPGSCSIAPSGRAGCLTRARSPSSNRARKTSVRRSASGASRLVRISSCRCPDRRPFAAASARAWTAR